MSFFTLHSLGLAIVALVATAGPSLAATTLTTVSTIATPTTPKASSTASAQATSTQVTWADIGDSFSSGVGWSQGKGALFDNDKDNCLRLDQAAAVQMKNDVSWGSSFMNFSACSGSHLEDMYGGNNYHSKQMDKVGTPQFVTMTAGGNDVGFADVLYDCLFDKYWGTATPPAYKNDTDCSQKCCKSIKRMNDTLNSEQMGEKVKTTMQKIFAHPAADKAVKAYGKFYIFWSAYPTFFNDQESWCEDVPLLPGRLVDTFLFKTPPLNQKLRRDINSVITNANRVLNESIASYPYPSINHKFARFVDPNPGFANHRFCEGWQKGHSFNPFNDPFIWLWNYQTDSHDSSLEVSTGGTSKFDTTPNITQANDPLQGHWSALDSQVAASSGGHASSGFEQRCCHPKAAGHKVMKDAFIEAIRKEDIANVK